MFSYLHYQSWLLYLGLLFLCILFCLCISVIPTHNLSFLNLTISLSFLLFFHRHFSFILSSHPHSTFFVFSISICHVCVSVSILFLFRFPRGSHILQSFLLHQHFCCSQAVSCCFVMFGGKVPLKCCRASLQKEQPSLCAYRGWIAFCVLSKPSDIVHCG